MPRHVDVVIIGAGPAGLSAGKAVAEASLTCLLIDKMGPGGELMNLGIVHKMPGLDPGTTGPDLIGKLLDEAMAAGAEIAVDEVASIEGESPFTVTTSEGPITATAVIVATGQDKGTTGLTEEGDFEGRGVSHCAICDGPLYAGKRVVVVGRDRWAVQEAIDLASMVEHVTLISDGALAMSASQRAALDGAGNIALTNGRVSKLAGDGTLEIITVGTSRIPAAGLFVFSNRRPATGFLAGWLATTGAGHIEAAAGGATSIPGIFTCGDVANPDDRIAVAIADGAKAGQTAALWVGEKF